METITFEQLPQAVSLLHKQLERIEQMLLEKREQSDTDELFTVRQAAAFLNLSVPTLYCKVSNREIPTNKRGRRLYFYKSELIDWVKGGRRKTMQELQQEAQVHLGKRSRFR